MIASAGEFLHLVTSDKPEEYMRAKVEAADTAVWHNIMENYPEMRIWVARNKLVPLEILDILSRDPNAFVRSEVATKNKIGTEIMSRLAADEDEAVRLRIAYNKNASIEILQELAQNKSSVGQIALEKLQAIQ